MRYVILKDKKRQQYFISDGNNGNGINNTRRMEEEQMEAIKKEVEAMHLNWIFVKILDDGTRIET